MILGILFLSSIIWNTPDKLLIASHFLIDYIRNTILAIINKIKDFSGSAMNNFYMVSSKLPIELNYILSKDGYNKENIVRAYNFAEVGHRGQQRKSGEPYITHPLNVAKLIASINGTESMVIAALLHDLLEDTSVREAEIKESFGTDILLIVKACTNLSSLSLYQERDEIEAERLRNIFLVLASEPRAAVIKIADRLHNMRTISALNFDRAKIIAKETLSVHAPISRRLGLRTFTSELEDLSFQVINQDAYNITKLEIEGTKSLISDLTNSISSISSHLDKSNLPYSIEGRIKNIFSVYNKSIKYGLSPISLHDLLGVRIIFTDEYKLYQALPILSQAFPDFSKRYKDYIKFPKSNGYRSIHSVISIDGGHKIELQLRTEEMHQNAEFGSASHWGYKEDIDKNHLYSWVDRLLKWQDDKIPLDENLKSAYLELSSSEDVLLITPKGDVMSLPKGATILDFAYSLHNDLGDSLSYGTINGKKSKISDTINDGDKIEIFTKSTNRPKIESLTFVKTAKARNAISKYYNKQIRARSINIGKTIFINHFLSTKIFYYNEELHKMLQFTSYKTKEDLFLAIYKGDYNISKYKIESNKNLSYLIFPHDADNDIITPLGCLDIKYLLAKCCMPKKAKYLKAISDNYKVYHIHNSECKTYIENLKNYPFPEMEFYKAPPLHYVQKIKLSITEIDMDIIDTINDILYNNSALLHKITVYDGFLEVILSASKIELGTVRTILRKIDKISSLHIIM
jgi:GTP pyrophosphokinase